MLIHPWDEASQDEWHEVLRHHDFGQLISAGRVDGYPVVVPTHFLYQGGDEVLLHLARPNPVWRAIEADPHVVLAPGHLAHRLLGRGGDELDPEAGREGHQIVHGLGGQLRPGHALTLEVLDDLPCRGFAAT